MNQTGNEFIELLRGGSLRSLGKSNSLISQVNTQEEFDKLFSVLFHDDRVIVMRAADVIEKISATNASYLADHKKEIFDLSANAKNKELMWHLALMIPRLPLDKQELYEAVQLLQRWAKDKNNSYIVRVNSFHGFYELVKKNESLMTEFKNLLHELEKEDIPSLIVRVKKIKKELFPDENSKKK